MTVPLSIVREIHKCFSAKRDLDHCSLVHAKGLDGGQKGGIKDGGNPRHRFNFSFNFPPYMETVIILERSSKHFSRFIDVLRTQDVINIKDVKKLVSHSTYYGLIIKRVFALNKILRDLHPDFYLVEPTFTVNHSKEVFTGLKRCKHIVIEAKQDFFILRYPNDSKEKNHPNPRNP